MAAKNDITGDAIQSKGPSTAYAAGWDRIFGNKEKDINITEPQAQTTTTISHKEKLKHENNSTGSVTDSVTHDGNSRYGKIINN